jgi:ABC-type phosphate transport system substrate-binding protein/tetratricopeptide (TPR) repeat protein
MDDPTGAGDPDAALDSIPNAPANLDNQRPSVTLPGMPPEAGRTFTPPQALPQGTALRIENSASMEVITQGLAQGFRQTYPNTPVSVTQRSSEEALASLQAGTTDLAAIGRSLRDDEKAQGLQEVGVSREKIAIIVGTNNPFQNDLEAEDFVRIFRGEITNWAELGGPDLPIRFIDRPANSDTRAALANYAIFGGDLTTGSTATPVASDSTADVVAALGDNGIGYAIASQVIQQNNVRVLSMHQTLPDDPRYPYSQPRTFVYRNFNPLPVQVEAFLAYATNAAGQEAVATAKAAEANDVAVADLPDRVVAMRPNGQGFVTGDRAGKLNFWNANGTSAGAPVDAHTGPTTALGFSSDGQRLISGGADGTIRFWDAVGNPIGRPINTGNGAVTSLAILPDGSFISANTNGTLQKWDATGNPVSQPIIGHEGAVRDMVVSPDGTTLITAAKDGTIRRWNLADGTQLGAPLVGHQGAVQALAMKPDGTFVSGGADGTVRRWDTNGIEVGAPIQVAGPVNAIASTADGLRLAVGDATGALQLFDGAGTPLGLPITDTGAAIDSLAYTPDGQRLVVSAGDTPQLRDNTGQVIAIPNQATNPAARPNIPPELYELWQQIKRLPPQVWWILPFLALGLLLLGLLRSFRHDDDGSDRDRPIGELPPPVDPVPPSSVMPEPTINGSIMTPPPQPGPLPIDTSLARAKQTLAEGISLGNAGLYQEALDCFNKAIELADLERLKAAATGVSLAGATAVIARGLALRGSALANLGRAEEATQSLNRALEMDPSDVAAWIGKGNVLTQMSQLDEALFCFDKAIDLNPNVAAAWQGKGKVLQKMGRDAEARTCFAKAESLGGINEEIPIGLGTPVGVPTPPPSYPDGSGYTPAISQPIGEVPMRPPARPLDPTPTPPSPPVDPYPITHQDYSPPAVDPYPITNPDYPPATGQQYPITNPDYPVVDPYPITNPDYPPATGQQYPITNPDYPVVDPYPITNPDYPPATGQQYPITNPDYPAVEGPIGSLDLPAIEVSPADLPSDLAAAIADIPPEPEAPPITSLQPTPSVPPVIDDIEPGEPITDPTLPPSVQQTLEYVPATPDAPNPNAPVMAPITVPPEVTAILEGHPTIPSTDVGTAASGTVKDPMAAFFGTDPTVAMRPPSPSYIAEASEDVTSSFFPPDLPADATTAFTTPPEEAVGDDYLESLPPDLRAALQGIPEDSPDRF